MNLKKIFARNIVLLFLDKIIRAFYTIILGAYIARYFGPEKFGFISILITLPSIFAVFSNFGADKILVKELATRPNVESKLLGTIFFSRLIACIILFSALVFYYYVVEEYTISNLLIAALISTSLLFNFADTLDLYFQSKLLNHKTILSKMLVIVTVSIIRIVMLSKQVSLVIFSISYFIEYLLNFVLVYLIFQWESSRIKLVFSKTVLKIVLSQSWPNILTGLMMILYMRIDQIIINILLNKKELGFFSAAVPFSTAVNFLPVGLSIILTPLLAGYRKSNFSVYTDSFKKLYSLVWLILLPYSILVAIFSEFLIKLFYGDAYLNSAIILMILVFNCIPVALGIFQEIWVTAEKKNEIHFYRALIGIVLNITLNFILIPMFGIIGSAIATLLTYYLSLVISNLVFCPAVFYDQVPNFKAIPYILKAFKYFKNPIKY